MRKKSICQKYFTENALNCRHKTESCFTRQRGIDARFEFFRICFKQGGKGFPEKFKNERMIKL